VTVTVVSCAYGVNHRMFIPRWQQAISNLRPAADDVIIVTDKDTACFWRHPQAFYLNTAIAAAETDWVWIADIDDLAFPDALAGLEDVDADVWQMGFKRSDGESYVPPQITNAEYLASEQNVYVGTSAIRVEAFRDVGGFRDVALQDWDIWRRLAVNGARFQSSGRTHFSYMLHRYSRGETELTLDRRPDHLAEMEAALVA
jgi:hypothetical protein